MYSSTSGNIPERPNRPLVVKCAYDGSARRVAFPSAATCRLDSLRNRVEECFSLSAAPFSLAYTDDDGEEFFIRTDTDLTEAISYFISGDDDAALSSYSGSNSGNMMYAFSAQKITIRLDVLVEYDGPSLSDTSSVSSFRTGTGSFVESEREGQSQGSWKSSGYEESIRSRRQSTSFGGVQEESVQGYEEDMERSTIHKLDDMKLDGQDQLSYASSSATHKKTSINGSSSSQRSSTFHRPPILTGPESDPAPSLLTHSDLGTRWLREQSRFAGRKLGPAPKSAARSNRYDSDEDSYGSDEETPGDISLVRDARGRYYYSYENDTSSRSSQSETDYTGNEAGPSSRRISNIPSEITLSTSPPKTPVSSSTPYDPIRIAEPAGPPILAPDCSACGIRLDYMRYVCQTCGEGDLWKENAPGKAIFIAPKTTSESDGSSSESTEWAAANNGSTGSQTVYNVANPRTRSSSSSTDDSSRSLRANLGGHSPTKATYRNGNGPTPPDSPVSSGEDLPAGSSTSIHGYELCVGCIEVHGIAHSKAAARAAKHKLSHAERRRRRNGGDFRHTFREKIWAAEGWVDVDYSEDSQCSICRHTIFKDRYKCVSCSNFDLCRTCYAKVDEIHPAHAFLSLPDKPLPTSSLEPQNDNHISNPPHMIPVPMRHPGAFCHNCLQDIVGPRFHCAVCAVDLCIQCEAVVMEVNGTNHTANHIMMKIPVPISSHEVDAVSRRARDRWFQQDRTVANSSSNPFLVDGETSSRSSSPTNDTVYAPTASRNRGASPHPPQQIINVTTRDALDHGMRCGNCNEWIMGRRFQCANCPSDPQGYNLCSICELRSYRVHDPSHVFLKFDRPVHIPVKSSRPVLPMLYRYPAGKVPTSAVATINPRDPTAYLKHVLHRETLCDVHGDQIRGVWLRCCHCAAGFDVCQEAERGLDHDPTHVFVLFKSRVDMNAFRALADLGATHSKPLLKQQVYVS